MQEEYNLEKTNEEEKNHRIFKRYFAFFFTLFLLIGSFWIGYTSGIQKQLPNDQIYPLGRTTVENKEPAGRAEIDFSLFWKVWDLLEEKHVDKNSLDAQKLVYGAIKGMLEATGDPYTSFFNPKETKSFAQDIEGSFEGIGAELGIKDDILTVIAPLDGSPAQKAGLLAGDKIIKIDERMTSDLTIDQAVELIRGKRDTEVVLIILRKGEEETKEIRITRATIEIKSVEVEFKENNIAHLKIIQFGEKTTREFDVAMKEIILRNSPAIILDLRNNPGGFLDKSIEIASRFMPRGKVVVIEEDSTGKRDSLRSTGGDRLSGIKTVVLINEGSASASEILAGALHDNLGTELIGKKSFGKGSVQELISLPGESSVKITVAKWLTPNGDYIMDKGITPDIEVELTVDDYKNERDPQMDKALETVKEMLK